MFQAKKGVAKFPCTYPRWSQWNEVRVEGDADEKAGRPVAGWAGHMSLARVERELGNGGDEKQSTRKTSLRSALKKQRTHKKVSPPS